MFAFNINKKIEKVVVITLLVLVVVLPLFSFVSVEPVYAQTKTVEECEGIKDNFFSPFDCALPNALRFMTETIFGVASWFAVTTAGLLDVTITFTTDVNSYKIPGIRIAWEVFRDLANMAFIFILLYIAFMTVLQIGGVGVVGDYCLHNRSRIWNHNEKVFRHNICPLHKLLHELNIFTCLNLH